MKTKKGYVIMSGSVDGATCEDDGFINCANFNLASGMVHETKKEAIEIRDQIIETDVEDFKTLWTEEDGYLIEVGSMNVNEELADKYVDVYYEGDVVNETIYKISEIKIPVKEVKKKIPNETEAYRNLLLSMLKHNGYYENIHKWMKLKGIDVEKAASMFNAIWDDIPDGMSAYYYLDSVEDALGNMDKDDWNNFDDAYDFRDYLNDNDGWKVY